MRKHLFSIFLSLFFIVHSSLGFSKAIHEDQLGLENSVELKQELDEIIFDGNGQVDLIKVLQFRDKVQKHKTEK